jgi:hypothetical protein
MYVFWYRCFSASCKVEFIMDRHALEVNLSDTFYFELLIPNLINLGNEMCELTEAHHVPVIH